MAEDYVDYYRIHDEDKTHCQLYTNVSYSYIFYLTILNFVRARSR